MASVQSHKPAHHQQQTTWPAPTKPNTGTGHTGHSGTNPSEHKFSTKVKEMASSVTKVFTEHKNQGKGNTGDKKDRNCFPKKSAGGDHHNKKKKEKPGMKTEKHGKDDHRGSHTNSDSD